MDLSTWVQPAWVFWTAAAVLVIATATETVLHHRLGSSLRLTSERLLTAVRHHEQEQERVEEILAVLRSDRENLERFQRLQRWVFYPVTGIGITVVALQTAALLARR